MLDDFTPDEFDERYAAELIDGDPVERLAGILKLGFAALVQSWGGKVNPEMFEPTRRIGTVVERERTEMTHATLEGRGLGGDEGQYAGTASPNQAAMLAAIALGPPDRHRT